MKNTKTRSVGAAPHLGRMRPAKAMTGLMLCAALLVLGACGQKRPLQLPTATKGQSHAAPAATTAPSAPASAASGAEIMPAR